MNVHKLIIIIIISIIFIYLNENIQENFITWYLPFYNKGTVELTKNTPKYLTSNLEYNYLEYDYIDKVKVFLLNKERQKTTNDYYTFLFANIIKTSQVKKLELNYLNDPLKVLKEVNDNKHNLAIISAPSIIENVSENLNLINNVNTVIVSNYRYIFFVTTKYANISNLKEIDKRNINVGVQDTDEYYIGHDILENLDLTAGVKPAKKTYYDIDESFAKLVQGEIDGMFFTDLYPSQILNKYILSDLEKTFVLVPITKIDYDMFKTRHNYMEEVALDLNSLPPNYLPVKIRSLYYTKFRPDYISYRYPDYIVCHKDAPPRLSNYIVKSIVYNLDILNESNFYLKNGWNYLAFPGLVGGMLIPIHVGAKIFFDKVSAVTTVPDEDCKYYLGKAQCNKTRLEGAKISANII